MTLPSWFVYEPALIVAVVEAALVLLVAFGVPITGDQKAAVIAFVSAILSLLGGLIIRSKVTPTAKIT